VWLHAYVNLTIKVHDELRQVGSGGGGWEGGRSLGSVSDIVMPVMGGEGWGWEGVVMECMGGGVIIAQRGGVGEGRDLAQQGEEVLFRLDRFNTFGKMIARLPEVQGSGGW
jgi:hypothetical protein